VLLGIRLRWRLRQPLAAQAGADVGLRQSA